ncbi:MAG: ATP-binding protein [Dehalococcoidia bacterium]|nr:ATP-binding protein [Dehalococcoidia bacterium]MCB9485792.1 ATP-binding protein [Thermoflexaceae bacterium]
MALLSGEPGIGKSCLLREFSDWALADGGLVLSGRASDTEGIPRTCPLSKSSVNLSTPHPTRIFSQLFPSHRKSTCSSRRSSPASARRCGSALPRSPSAKRSSRPFRNSCFTSPI